MPRAERGKLVKQDGILIDIHSDGSAHFRIEGPGVGFGLEERQLIILHKLVRDVLSWDED